MSEVYFNTAYQWAVPPAHFPAYASKSHTCTVIITSQGGKSGAVNISTGLFLDQCFQSPSEGPISWFIQIQNSVPCCWWRESNIACIHCRVQRTLWRSGQWLQLFNAPYQKSIGLNCQRKATLSNSTKRKFNTTFVYHHIPVVSSGKNRPSLGSLFKNSHRENHKKTSLEEISCAASVSDPAGCNFR